MGRNAARRRDAKLEATLAKAATVRQRRTSKATERLRVKMRELETRSQFEQMLAMSADASRPAMRRLLEPMLRDDLPCCGPAALAVRMGQPLSEGQHTLYCPTRRPDIELTDDQ